MTTERNLQECFLCNHDREKHGEKMEEWREKIKKRIMGFNWWWEEDQVNWEEEENWEAWREKLYYIIQYMLILAYEKNMAKITINSWWFMN